MPGFDLRAVQDALRRADVDAWLFFQFHGRDPLADRVLGLDPEGLQTRRWYYLVPSHGEPRGLVHAIEPDSLATLPGDKTRYRTWKELDDGLGRLLGGLDTVAMQYSPKNRMAAVATVDAGTVELVRSLGVEVVSSADLVQAFTAVLDDEQIAAHRYAAERLPPIVFEAFRQVRRRILDGAEVTEYEIQQGILERLDEDGLVTVEPPIVAVNAHAADPHYAPAPGGSSVVCRADWLLVDVWGKKPGPEGVYADITWTAQVDDRVPDERREVFETVRSARDAAVTLIRERYAAGEPVRGFEADRAARRVLEAGGFTHGVRHRTGHSITHEIHGSGANLDDFESHDERLLMRRTCFSVEPGLYLERFGVRSEVDVLIPPDGPPEVSGVQQDDVILLLADPAPELPERS